MCTCVYNEMEHSGGNEHNGSSRMWTCYVSLALRYPLYGTVYISSWERMKNVGKKGHPLYCKNILACVSIIFQISEIFVLVCGTHTQCSFMYFIIMFVPWITYRASYHVACSKDGSFVRLFVGILVCKTLVDQCTSGSCTFLAVCYFTSDQSQCKVSWFVLP